MAKVQGRREARRRGHREEELPLRRENFVILGVGVLVILMGYAAMMEGSVEGFLPLVVAPILLVLGYCVIFPLGILYRKGTAADVSAKQKQSEQAGA
jgi:hypothetical protein